MKCLVMSSFLAVAVAACSSDPAKTSPTTPAPQPATTPPPDKQEAPKSDTAATTPAPAPAAVDMDADIKKLQAKAEHGAPAIEVQHILISFAGTGTKARRTKAEAEALAKQLYAEVMAGGDFDALVSKHTDDSAPGKYGMTNHGAPAVAGSYPRGQMVAAFGNVGWRLEVGEIGVAPFDPGTSRYGWHIIKRTK